MHTGLVEVFLRWAAVANLQRPAVLTDRHRGVSNLVQRARGAPFKPLVASFDEPRPRVAGAGHGLDAPRYPHHFGSDANLIVVEAARTGSCRIGLRRVLARSASR